MEHVLCKQRIGRIHKHLGINTTDAEVLVCFLGLDSGVCRSVTKEEIQAVLTKLAAAYRLSVTETILRIKQVLC